jgi:hypothetical protein
MLIYDISSPINIINFEGTIKNCNFTKLYPAYTIDLMIRNILKRGGGKIKSYLV